MKRETVLNGWNILLDPHYNQYKRLRLRHTKK